MAEAKDNVRNANTDTPAPVALSQPGSAPGGLQNQANQQQNQKEKKAEVYDYTYFSSLPEGMPVELIDGQVLSLSPASNYRHQKISGFIFRRLANYIEEKDKDAEIFYAPFDIFLFNDNQELAECKNIVHPDIILISDKKRIMEKGYKGAPDLVVEIVSQGTKNRDYIQKLALYGQFGVKEYWIVNPKSLTISVYKAGEDGFADTDIYTFNEKIKVGVLDDFEIDFAPLFTKLKSINL